MADRTREFAENLKDAHVDKKSEKIVRGMVSNIAKKCPIPLLVQLGQCLLDNRLAEIRSQIEQN